MAPPPPPTEKQPAQREPVCAYCGTLNGENFKFCKNCGAPLSSAPQQNNYYSQPAGEPIYQAPPPPMPQEPPVTEIDGIPTEDLHHFVGKNSDKIVGKWARMQKTGSSVSWCWPVAILSYALGLAGAAFWFLYRRMYGLGIGLLAGALLLFGVQTALMSQPIADMGEHILNNEEYLAAANDFIETGDIALYMERIEEISKSDPAMAKAQTQITLLSDVFSYINLAALALFGMFSMKIYKSHAKKKLGRFKARPTPAELSLSGGTSGGALAIGIVLFAMLSLTIVVAFSLYLISTLIMVVQ